MGANDVSVDHDVSVDSDQFVLLERRDSVAHLQLNRPAQFNALSSDMMSALQSMLDSLANDESVRVVVIGAAGKAFCAGHDLREMSAHPALAFYQALFAQCSRLMMTIQAMPKPVVARVHGLATAAGCQLVAMCDLAVAASDARFAVSGVNLGLFCATPSVALARNLSRKKAFEMLVTGEFVSAEEALRDGLVNRVVAPDQLDRCVDQLCTRIASKPAVAIAMGKGLFYKQLEMGITAAYQLAGQTMACNMVEPAAQEGTLAFLEKRQPNWG